MRKTVSLLIAIALVFSLTACGIKSSPASVTNKFFEALKAGDTEKAIKCFTPTIQKQFEIGYALYGGLFGVGSDAISTVFEGLIGSSTNSAYSDYEFKIVKTEQTDKEHATVYVDVYVDGQKSETTSFDCIIYDGEWYILN